MKKNSTIEKHSKYVAPHIVEMCLESEGCVLSGSDVTSDGLGGGGFEPDPDFPGIDF
jgi:hypothetical protein